MPFCTDCAKPQHCERCVKGIRIRITKARINGLQHPTLREGYIQLLNELKSIKETLELPQVNGNELDIYKELFNEAWGNILYTISDTRVRLECCEIFEIIA